jgi:hypothetical protein
VGASTILATAARIGSETGHLAIAENARVSLLPLYFGAMQISSGICTVLPVGSGRSGAIHIVTRPQGSGGSAAEWVRAELRSAGAPAERVMVDAGAGNSEELDGGAFPLKLVVAVPDVNCAARLAALAGSAGNQTVRILFNKFDETEPMHVMLVEQARHRFGELVLPFSIRHSRLVPEALAEGRTVIDYAPESGVAMDFLKLAAWLRSNDGI